MSLLNQNVLLQPILNRRARHPAKFTLIIGYQRAMDMLRIGRNQLVIGLDGLTLRTQYGLDFPKIMRGIGRKTVVPYLRDLSAKFVSAG